MKKLTNIVLILCAIFSVSASAKDWSKESSWLGNSDAYACDALHKNSRTYYDSTGYKSRKIIVGFCNKGGFVVQNVKAKIFRMADGWTPKIAQQEKKANINKDYGHAFLFNIGLVNKGETLKIEIEYKLSTGFGTKKKKCTKQFVYNYDDVIYLAKTEGSKWDPKCKTVKLDQKS